MNRSVQFSLLFILLSAIFVIGFNRIEAGKFDESEKVIRSDGSGYYAYLPKLFIDQNLDFSEVSDSYIINYKYSKVNKYFVGTSVLMAPFFGMGYLVASWFNYPLDGYSLPFQLSIALAALVYLMLGLFLLSRLLSQLGFKKLTITFSLLLLFFGTNLLFYGLFDQSMSHVYSFFLITTFLYFFNSYVRSRNFIRLIAAAATFGLLVLSRPTNGIIVLLLPFLIFMNDGRRLFNEFSIWKLIIPLLMVGSICFIQCLAWYAQTGEFIIWGYQNEGFYFSRPEILNVLFSFNKGWFIYTPIALVAMIGIVPLWKRDRVAALSIIIFCLVLIYITSSWWNWYYGSSFGMRPMVDFYSIIAILLAFLIEYLPKRTAPVVGFLLVSMAALNMFQHYQYAEKILAASDMNYAKYKAIFGVIEADEVILGGTNDLPSFQAKSTVLFQHEYEDFTNTSFGVSYDESRKKEVIDYKGKEYNFTLNETLDERAITDKGLYLEFEFDRYENEIGNSTNAQIIVQLSDSSENRYYYHWFNLNEVPANTLGWKSYQYKIRIPGANTQKDFFSLYIRNEEGEGFLLDKLKVKLTAQ